MWLCIFVWLIYRQEMCVWSVVFVVTVLVGTNSCLFQLKWTHICKENTFAG